jgi:LDH2 family malate/lactate/ureidoglycolate dehydrogenase
MLERFKVPQKDEVRVPQESLRRTVAATFEKMGVSPEDAAEGADVLVMTDLRGVETHGVSTVMRYYVQQYTKGELNARPKMRVVRETPGTAVLDADNGLGIIVLYPGLSEYKEERDRRTSGIPLHREVVQWFDDIAGELSVPKLQRVRR